MLHPNVDCHACAGILYAAAVTMSLQKCLMLLGTASCCSGTEFYRILLNFQVLNSQSMDQRQRSNQHRLLTDNELVVVTVERLGRRSELRSTHVCLAV